MSVNAPVSTALPLVIRSAQGDYQVDFLESIDALRDLVAPLTDVFLLVDKAVRDLYPSLLSAFDPARTYAMAATEDEKTLAGVERVAAFLQNGGASRSSTLLVLGGGILQDVGTFVAHIYYRGIPYVYVRRRF